MPHSSGQQIAAWSPAATPSRVWPSMIRAVRPDDRHVGEQPGDQAGADRGAVDGRHDRLRAVDDVEHEVARLAHDPRAHRVVVDDVVEQLEAAARGERLSRAASTATRVSGSRSTVSHTSASWRCDRVVDRVQPGTIQRDPQHARRRTVEREIRVPAIEIGHE